MEEWMYTCLLAACFAAILILGGVLLYYRRSWKRFDSILQKLSLEGELPCSDVLDTRESKLVSQLMRILSTARFKEQMARREKDEVTGLLSDISHQLKTPLANIVMNMEILEKGQLDDGQRQEFLARSRQQAQKIQWLMQTLIKASRLENKMLEFPSDMEGIKQTLAVSVSAVYGQAVGRQIQIEMEEFKDFPLYHNRKWTAEALGNILENAVKYSPLGSIIDISIERLEIYSKINITDQGLGIPVQEYPKIFTRFFRGKSVSQMEGSGLGLYIAQLILNQEGGYITVSSKVGKGSCFSVFLLNRPGGPWVGEAEKVAERDR